MQSVMYVEISNISKLATHLHATNMKLRTQYLLWLNVVYFTAAGDDVAPIEETTRNPLTR